MISALVTIYNPTDIKDNIRYISEQVDRVFICDNSPVSNSTMFSNIGNAIYVFNNKNMGLSRAFNTILKDESYNWGDDEFVVFFDQDSKIKPNHISTLIAEFELLEKHDLKVGNIGPIYYDLNTKEYAVPKVKKQVSEDDYIVPSVITSSMLCRYSALKEVDFWNEELFLDFADWDLCFRLREYGYVCIKTKAVVLDHALGLGEMKVGLISIGKSATIREYYQTRDALYLLHKKYAPFRYKLRFFKNITLRPVFHCVFLDHGKERMKYVRDGFRDYKEGYYGEYRGSSR